VAALLFDDDADLSLVQQRNVAVLGYGEPARAQALSLRDSGVDVRVGLPEGSADWELAEAEGLRVVPAYDACEEADLVAVLAPHTDHPRLFAEAVEPNLVDGDAVIVATAFAFRFGFVRPPAGVDVCLVAPQAPGDVVRDEFVDGRGVPVLVGVEQDASGSALDLALSYAKGIGGTRAAAVPTTGPAEVDAVLFAEQAVGGAISALVHAAFETLVEAGCPPEVGYLACRAEIQRVAERLGDVVGDPGAGRPVDRTGDTERAAFGRLTRGPLVVSDETRLVLRSVLGEVSDGSFAREWMEEYAAGLPRYRHLVELDREHPFEDTARQLRPVLGRSGRRRWG